MLYGNNSFRPVPGYPRTMRSGTRGYYNKLAIILPCRRLLKVLCLSKRMFFLPLYQAARPAPAESPRSGRKQGQVVVAVRCRLLFSFLFWIQPQYGYTFYPISSTFTLQIKKHDDEILY